MGSVCADTTQQGTTVRNVHRYTMISLGSREMEKQGHQMNAEVSGSLLIQAFRMSTHRTSRQSSLAKNSVDLH